MDDVLLGGTTGIRFCGGRSSACPATDFVSAIALLSSLIAISCGGSTASPGNGGVVGESGQGVATFVVGRSLADGSIFVSSYIAPFQFCSPLRRDDVCSIEYVDTCWPPPGPQAVLPNAGTISATDGKETLSYVPDADGWYRTRSGGTLDPEAVITISATGANVPAFQAEIAIPHGSLAPESPAKSSQVSRSSPLDVAWTGTTDAERAGITIQMSGIDASNRITCHPAAQPTHFEMPIAFTNALVPGARTVLGIAPVNKRSLTVKDWTIDVIADGAGSGYLIDVSP